MTAEHVAYHVLAIKTAGSYAALKNLRSRFVDWSACLANHPGIGPSLSEEARAGLEGSGSRLVLREDPGYPLLLKHIPHPPHALYIKGVLPAEGMATVAIVGTRKATAQGKETAAAMGRNLAAAGCAVVSGLAYGIDAAAHAGCLQGEGPTVAVLAHGLDAVHPRGNERLAEKILSRNGALVSEYPPGIRPLAYRFLERNRIISGLARATVVIEAPARSGVLATSRFAMEQNRDLLVVPGPAAHPNFQGSHELIRAGAMLVRHAADVLRELDLDGAPIQMPLFGGKEKDAILEVLAISGRGLTIDEIIETTNLHPSTVHQNITFLLLEGAVREKSGGYIVI